ELVADRVFSLKSGVFGMGDFGIADIAVHRESVVGSEIVCPVDSANGIIKLLGGLDAHLQNRLKHSNGRPQRKIGTIEQNSVPSEVDAASTRFNVRATQVANLVG